jgi:hypothetical protein
MTGIGILSQRDPTPWLWGRVAGDAVDLAPLAPGLRADNPRQRNVSVAVATVAGVTMLDAVCAQRLSTAARNRAATRRRPQARAYSRRRGLPRPPEAMRGAARDLKVPEDIVHGVASHKESMSRTPGIIGHGIIGQLIEPADLQAAPVIRR